MDNKKQFGKNITAFLLVIALMLPVAVQFFHAMDGHEHFACNEQTTHLHETVDKCEICHFHLASVNYDIAGYPDFETVIIPSRLEKQLVSVLFHSFIITNTQLRAPPHFLS